MTTEAEKARELYDRINRDSGGKMAPYDRVTFVAQLLKRDPFVVLNAIGLVRVADDDEAFKKTEPR